MKNAIHHYSPLSSAVKPWLCTWTLTGLRHSVNHLLTYLLKCLITFKFKKHTLKKQSVNIKWRLRVCDCHSLTETSIYWQGCAESENRLRFSF